VQRNHLRIKKTLSKASDEKEKVVDDLLCYFSYKLNALLKQIFISIWEKKGNKMENVLH